MDTYKVFYAKCLYESRSALLMIKNKRKCSNKRSYKIYNYNYIIKLII